MIWAAISAVVCAGCDFLWIVTGGKLRQRAREAQLSEQDRRGIESGRALLRRRRLRDPYDPPPFGLYRHPGSQKRRSPATGLR